MEQKHLAWLAVGAAVLTAWLAVSRLVASSPASVAPPAVPEATAWAGPPPPAGGPTQAAAVSRGAAPDRPAPEGLSDEQWRELQAALADHPQRDAEIARITAYLAYQRTAQRFQQLRAQVHEQAHEPATSELTALARTLQAGVDEHLARGEMTAAEALQLRAATLDVLEPDSATRQTLLAAWRQGVIAASTRAPDPRESDFEQQQAALVAQWSARPAGQRDPRALEAQLDALRQRIFTPPR